MGLQTLSNCAVTTDLLGPICLLQLLPQEPQEPLPFPIPYNLMLFIKNMILLELWALPIMEELQRFVWCYQQRIRQVLILKQFV